MSHLSRAGAHRAGRAQRPREHALRPTHSHVAFAPARPDSFLPAGQAAARRRRAPATATANFGRNLPAGEFKFINHHPLRHVCSRAKMRRVRQDGEFLTRERVDLCNRLPRVRAALWAWILAHAASRCIYKHELSPDRAGEPHGVAVELPSTNGAVFAHTLFFLSPAAPDDGPHAECGGRALSQILL